jgi:hypothetical protein
MRIFSLPKDTVRWRVDRQRAMIGWSGHISLVLWFQAMDCPRCGLLNPPEARRCDCGYDFTKGTVEQAYFRQGLPTELKTSLAMIVLLNFVAGISAFAAEDPVRVVVALCLIGLMWFLYAMVVMKHFWAYVALIVITFPIGLVLLANVRGVRLYCLQR